jgi:GT2 family glycosyltransferase
MNIKAAIAKAIGYHQSGDVNSEDVVNAYRLFLGRMPESDYFIKERVGVTLRTLAHSFILSSEYFSRVCAPLQRQVGLDPSKFRNPPPQDLRTWAADRLPLSEATAASIRVATTWEALFSHLEADPVVRELKSGAATIDPATAGAVVADVHIAVSFILGRRPSKQQCQIYSGIPLWSLAEKLLTSPEFDQTVVQPLMYGQGATLDGPLPPATLRWLSATFGVGDGETPGNRLFFLAEVIKTLQQHATLTDSKGPDFVFKPEALVELLSQRGPEADRRRETFQRLELLVQGLRPVAVLAMRAVGVRTFEMLTDDPHLIFEIEADVAKSEVIEISFGVAGARRGARGRLYIDYGEGFSEAVAMNLDPAERRLFSAYLLRPSRIRLVRWDPDITSGEITIWGISARGLTTSAIADAANKKGRAIAFSALFETSLGLAPTLSGAPSDFVLSTLLTQTVGDHRSADPYRTWIDRNELQGDAAKRDAVRRLSALPSRPIISVLVPTYDTPSRLLREMIESVMAQSYPDWELCIADDASPSPHVRAILEGYAVSEPRIRLAFRETNGHIVAASNTALELVRGDWFALLDHDDLLAPDALLSVAEEIVAHPDAILIYSDEDKINLYGDRSTPFFKPNFSPNLLLAQNYFNHLTVHRTERVRALGGWRFGYDGSQDYDLNLRMIEGVHPRQVRHIPKVLYHWRALEGSTALAVEEKPYAIKAGRRAVQEHLERQGLKAQVTGLENLPFNRVRHALASPPPLVSLIIPTRDMASVLQVCVESILRLSTYTNYEIIIVDNGSEKAETFVLFELLARDPRVRILSQPGPFNYSAINNAAVAECGGEIIGLVNNDVEVITPDWIEEMVSWAAQPEIGCVGAKLYYANDTIQHAGVVLGLGGVAGHSHKHSPRDALGYYFRISVHHDVSAVTAACLFIRRSVYNEVGGLDTQLRVAFNDVDFCMRVREAGYRNLFTPYAELYHYESISRGLDTTPEKQRRHESEVKFMQTRWGEKLIKDPFYSPNLTHEREDYSIA